MLTTPTFKRYHIVGILALALLGLTYLTRPYFPLAAQMLFLLGGLALSIIWLRGYWRSIGEVARDAQKTAWLWGGTAGGIIAMIAMMIPLLAPLFQDVTGQTGAGPSMNNLIFLGGAVTVFLAQVAGFLAYWAYWWARTR